MKLKYSWLKVWIIPGAVFQSVTVGGAYGTGRDVVEWISQYGALAGLASGAYCVYDGIGNGGHF